MAQPQPVEPDDVHADAFAAFIVAARERRGWTQDELVQRSGVSRAALQRWEAGREAHPDPDQLRAVARALGVDARLGAVALGSLAASEVSDVLADDIDGLLANLRDRTIPSAVKAAAVERLRTMIRPEPQALLDAETQRFLEELAITSHQKPAEVLAALVQAEYDRQFPGKREHAKLPAEERRRRLMETMGWSRWPTLDEDGTRQLDRQLADVEEQARRFYSEGRAAA